MNLADQLAAANGIQRPAAPLHNAMGQWATLFGLAPPHPLPQPTRAAAPRERRTANRTPGELGDELVDALRCGPGSIAEIAMQVSARHDNVRKSLVRLERKGIVRKTTAVMAGRHTSVWGLME